MERFVVVPSRQLNCLEAVGQLLVGRQSTFRVRSTGADQRDTEIRGQKAQCVEQNPLLPVRAGEQRMNLINDEYPSAYKLHQVARDPAQMSSVCSVSGRRLERAQEL
jgi:hypothetical protein